MGIHGAEMSKEIELYLNRDLPKHYAEYAPEEQRLENNSNVKRSPRDIVQSYQKPEDDSTNATLHLERAHWCWSKLLFASMEYLCLSRRIFRMNTVSAHDGRNHRQCFAVIIAVISY